MIDPMAWHTVGVARSVACVVNETQRRISLGTLSNHALVPLRAIGHELASLAASTPLCDREVGNIARKDLIQLTIAFTALLDTIQEQDAQAFIEKQAACIALNTQLAASVTAVISQARSELPHPFIDTLLSVFELRK